MGKRRFLMNYKLLNDADGNNEILLDSTNITEAYEEALEILGWTMIASKSEEETDCQEDVDD
jgi:hypothetical protein